MARFAWPGALAAALLLSACNSSDSAEPGTTLTVDAKDKNGESVAIAADGETGEVSIDVPGFQGKIDLPKLDLNDGNFDIDGVKLYPGTKITAVNVTADEQSGGGETVKIGFAAPAALKDVVAWQEKAFTDGKIKVTRAGDRLSGATADGERFSVDYAESAPGRTTGTILFTDTKS